MAEAVAEPVAVACFVDDVPRDAVASPEFMVGSTVTEAVIWAFRTVSYTMRNVSSGSPRQMVRVMSLL